jgi:glucose/arabinose dehydrogenase
MERTPEPSTSPKVLRPRRRSPFAAAALLLAVPLLAVSPASVFQPAIARSAGPFTDVGTVPGVGLQKVTSGLGAITSITHAGDGRLFVTVRDGLVQIVENGQVRPEPFIDLRPFVKAGGEQGLLSLAFDPHYAENGYFFVAYTDELDRVVVARHEASSDDPNQAQPGTEAILMEIPKPTPLHNGGQLAFGPDGYLYISVGDGAVTSPPDSCMAQRDDTMLGKILRIDVDDDPLSPPYYTVPADNPFFSNASPDELWATGLRNPWRLSFDRVTGDLWIADVGGSEREEINLQPAGSPGGQNYGWKIMEGTTCFRATGCPETAPPCGSPLYTLPVLEYTHAGDKCSVTGGYVYRGRRLPQLYGSYIFGDFCVGTVWVADPKGQNLRVRSLTQGAPLLTAFGEGADGEIYLGTITGDLYRIVGRSPVDSVAIYDEVAGRFFFRDLHAAGAADRSLLFGGGGSLVPLAGDWNGDRRTTIGLFDPATGNFQIKNTLDRTSAEIRFRLAGKPGAVPLVGDWNKDGRDTVGFYDPSTRTFQLKNTLAGGKFDVTVRFGQGGPGWIPLAGDWNGDGRDTVGLYDPVTSTFHLKNSFKGTGTDVKVQFGPNNNGWLPLVGDWDGDGRDTIGFYDPTGSVFRLKNTLTNGGTADWLFRFGAVDRGWVPLVGEW